jgi:hypothetical protein
MTNTCNFKKILRQVHENEALTRFETLLYSAPGTSAISGLKLGDNKKISKLEELSRCAAALDLIIRASSITLLFLFFQNDIQTIIKYDLPIYLKTYNIICDSKGIHLHDDHDSITSTFNKWRNCEKIVQDFGWILRKWRRGIISSWIDILLHRPQSIVLIFFEY